MSIFLADSCNGSPLKNAKLIKIVPEIFGGNIPRNDTDQNNTPFHECIPGIYKKVTWSPIYPQAESRPLPDVYRCVPECCIYPTSAPPIYGHPQQNYGPVEAAIQSRHTYELLQAPHNHNYPVGPPQIIEVPPNYGSVLIHFKTAGSAVNIRQSHMPGPVPSVEHITINENAQRMIQDVFKPVIQEVREIIQPYRRVTQEIRPVIEEVHTVVNKGQRGPSVALSPEGCSSTFLCRRPVYPEPQKSYQDPQESYQELQKNYQDPQQIQQSLELNSELPPFPPSPPLKVTPLPLKLGYLPSAQRFSIAANPRHEPTEE